MKKKKVQVVITNSFKEVLLLKMNKRRGYFWQNVTGGVEENEKFMDAAIRESIEETGIETNNIYKLTPLKREFEFIDQYGNEVHEKCFHLMAKENWTVKLDPAEHADYYWKNISKINLKDVHYPSNYQAIEEVRNTIE